MTHPKRKLFKPSKSASYAASELASMPHDHDHVTIGETPYESMWAETLNAVKLKRYDDAAAEGWKDLDAICIQSGMSRTTAMRRMKDLSINGTVDASTAVKTGKIVSIWRPVQK